MRLSLASWACVVSLSLSLTLPTTPAPAPATAASLPPSRPRPPPVVVELVDRDDADVDADADADAAAAAAEAKATTTTTTTATATQMRTAKGKQFSCEREGGAERQLRRWRDTVGASAVGCVETPLAEIRRVAAATAGEKPYWNAYGVCLYRNATQSHVNIMVRTEDDGTVAQYVRKEVTMMLGTYVRGDATQTFEGPDGRTTQVVVECDPDAAVGARPTFVSASEVRLKTYEIRLRAKDACGVPADAASATQTESAATTESTPAANALSVLSDVCVTKSMGWWSFEVCVGRSVRQFHGSPPRPEDDHLLGTFDAEATKAAKPKPYTAVEVFSAGSSCGSGSSAKPRTARVTYRCALDADLVAIESVDESPLCQYNIRLASSALCAIRGFRRNDDHLKVEWKCYPRPR